MRQAGLCVVVMIMTLLWIKGTVELTLLLREHCSEKLKLSSLFLLNNA